MRPTSITKKRLLSKMLRSSLSLLKAVLRESGKFLSFGIEYVLLEVFLALFVIGLSYLFTSWSIPLSVASVMAIGLTLILFILTVYISFKSNNISKPKGDLKLAHWIAQTFSSKSSPEWSEYQDWLHDILFSRGQLLDAKYPQWKVKLITYRRLSAFLIVVVISKLRQFASNIRRSL